MSNHTMEYIALKASQKKQEEDKQKNITNQRNEAFIKSYTTVHTKIPDMRSAYQSVRESNYEPSQAEIHYRRITSGRVIDGPRNK